MNTSKFSILISFIFVATTSFAQNSEIYSPFSFVNPEKLNYANGGGYCKTASDEKKLWTEINKFSKSFLHVVPNIPPEQKAYINAELNSSNSERQIRITSNSFYLMNDLYEEVSNIEKLSSTFLKNQARLPLQKKMEIIGRTLANVTNEGIPSDLFQSISADLKAKGYHISAENFRTHWGVKFGIKQILISNLICYGEKSN
jgi:hypothetical protein